MKFYNFWYKLEFSVLRQISGLPLYSGIHWSAFIRRMLKNFSSLSAAQLEINVIPLHSKSEYQEKDEIILYIATNHSGKDVLEKWLFSDINNYIDQQDDSHFILNQTVEFSNWESFQFIPDQEFSFNPDDLSKIALIFNAPLRLKRKDKSEGRFFDPFHFDFSEFIENLAKSLDLPMPDISSVNLSQKSFIWLDIPYKKTLGGIVGGIVIRGKFSPELLELIHFGQFCGLGKNRSFGFGFYYIKEFPLPVYQAEYHDYFSFSKLREKLIYMADNNEPGTDMTAKELLEHPRYLRKVSKLLNNEDYCPQDPKIFKIKKKNGGFRKIAAYSITDKLILSILSDKLNLLMNNLITSNCYAYRKGYSSHLAADALKKEFNKGFDWAIKLDIKSFFDSISVSKIALILTALNIPDEFINLLMSYFSINLIQGNNLSPLLSNFAMLPFDRWFRNQKKLKLIRYADDMVIIARNFDKSSALEKISFMLDNLGLKINYEKYMEFFQTSEINFLGYHISESRIYSISKKQSENDYDQWLPYPKIAKVMLKPLFLSFSITYASTTGNHVIVKSKDVTQKVVWKNISRIVILGKPRISGGIIYRAIKEQVPLYFLTIHGRPLGGYLNFINMKSVKEIFNEDQFYCFDEFCIDFAREIVFTKIINQYRILKKRQINEPALTEISDSLKDCDNIDSLRGKEGFAAKVYYKHFRSLVAPLPFDSRSYHPPKGPVNVLLSLGYSLLYRRVSESLRANGINPFIGIIHQGRGAHEALASDLVECFRFIIDRIVIALVNKKLITIDNFYRIENSNYLKLDSHGFRTFIRYYENTMKRNVKIKGMSYSYEVWIEKSVLSLKNSLNLGSNFNAYRSL